MRFLSAVFLITLLVHPLYWIIQPGLASARSRATMLVGGQEQRIKKSHQICSTLENAWNKKERCWIQAWIQKIYQAPVKFSLYLPPCYEQKSSTRYPVLYLLHGQTYDNHQWIHLGLPEVADTLINDHKIYSDDHCHAQ